MRIVHVTDCYLPLMGGIETHVSRLSQAQIARGHTVTVFTATPEHPGRGLTIPWDTDRAWRGWLGSNTMPQSDNDPWLHAEYDAEVKRESEEAHARGQGVGPLVHRRGRWRRRALSGVTRVRQSPPPGAGDLREMGGASVAPGTPRVVRTAWMNPLGLPFDPRASRRFMRWLDTEIGLGRTPDVLHLHLGELTPGVMGLLRLLRDRGVPVVVSVHSVWQQGTTVPLYRRLARVAGVADAPFIWAPVSELVAGRVRQIVPAGRVAVQPNGVDQEQWRMDPVPHEGLVAVAATRFAPRKRVPELLELLRRTGDQLGLNHPADAVGQPQAITALGPSYPDDAVASSPPLAEDEGIAREAPGASGTTDPLGGGDSASVRLPPQGGPECRNSRTVTGQSHPGIPKELSRPPLRVVIAGEGSGLASARRFIASYGMTGWVKLPGRLTGQKLRDLYAHSDIYLAPGVNDAFSVAGIEARAAGLAVLSRAQSGFGADLEDETEGCAADTDQEMTDALVRWTLDHTGGGTKVQDIKEHNRTSEYRHSWDQVVPDIHALYRRAADLVA